MHIPSRSAFIAVTILLMARAIAPQVAWAQTPAQMEYERQQREYRQAQERQREDQRRQQQLMNENARRQQDESRRLNAPMGQSQTPNNQGATPQTAARPPGARSDATAATAAAKWVEVGNSPAHGGSDIYADPVTIRRSGNMARMWDMHDYKTARVVEGKRVASSKMEYEYDCKGARMRNLSVTGFSAKMGKGDVVGYGHTPQAWEAVAPGTIQESLRKIACGKR